MEPLTTTHWGSYRLQLEDGRLVGVRPVTWDRHPSADRRVAAQYRAWGDAGPTPRGARRLPEDGPRSRERRGRNPSSSCPGTRRSTSPRGELRRVIGAHGNEAIFGGSYGWSSAGRFHHAQSQAAPLPAHDRRLYRQHGQLQRGRRAASSCAASPRRSRSSSSSTPNGRTSRATRELFVAFGGLPVKNAQVNPGGASEHTVPRALRAWRRAGVASSIAARSGATCPAPNGCRSARAATPR